MTEPGRIRTTAWGAAWIGAIARSHDMDGPALSRGRGAAARGVVADVSIEPGGVGAGVRRRGAAEHRVRIGFRRWTDADWDVARTLLAGSGRLAAAVLRGDLPDDLVALLDERGLRLLPAGGDASIDCSCGVVAGPCSHAVAVCCHLADLVDGDPLLLVTLRGGDRAQLLPDSSARSGAAGAGSAALPGRVAAIPGRSADPTMPAGTAWRRRRDDVPVLDHRLHGAGRPRRGTLAPPPELGFDQTGIDRLVGDAAGRAVAALRAVAQGDAAPGRSLGLTLDLDTDVVRRVAAASLDVSTAATVLGVEPPMVDALTRAWVEHGEPGVDVLLHPRRLGPDEVTAVTAAVGGSVRARSTGALLDDGRQLRRSASGEWALVVPNDAGPRVAGVAPSLADLVDDQLLSWSEG